MCAGRQTEDDHAGVSVAESWDRFSPILPVPISAALLSRNQLAILHESRAAGASDHFAIELIQTRRHRLYSSRLYSWGYDSRDSSLTHLAGLEIPPGAESPLG